MSLILDFAKRHIFRFSNTNHGGATKDNESNSTPILSYVSGYDHNGHFF